MIYHYYSKQTGWGLKETKDCLLYTSLSDLSKAKKFIFMEYHAIEDKESWHRIHKVLTERVQAGVEVRVFYDDMGSIFFIDRDFSE